MGVSMYLLALKYSLFASIFSPPEKADGGGETHNGELSSLGYSPLEGCYLV